MNKLIAQRALDLQLRYQIIKGDMPDPKDEKARIKWKRERDDTRELMYHSVELALLSAGVETFGMGKKKMLQRFEGEIV